MPVSSFVSTFTHGGDIEEVSPAVAIAEVPVEEVPTAEVSAAWNPAGNVSFVSPPRVERTSLL